MEETLKVKISYEGYGSTDHNPMHSEVDFEEFVEDLQMKIKFIKRENTYDHFFEIEGDKQKLIDAWEKKPDGRYVKDPLGEGDYLGYYSLYIEGEKWPFEQAPDPVFFEDERVKYHNIN